MTIELEILCRSALTGRGWTGPARIRLDATGCIRAIEDIDVSSDDPRLSGYILPGMPNLHSHAFQRLIAGLTEHAGGSTDSFWTWREAMYRLANRIDPDQLEAVAAWVQVEMLEAGFTSCGEFHYLHHQPEGRPYSEPAEMCHRMLAAAAASGIALTLLPVLYCRGGVDAEGVSEQQRRFRHSPETFVRLVEDCRAAIAGHPLHRAGVAPHSLRAVSPGQLRAVLEDPVAQQGPVHIHIAEQPAEVDEVRRAFGARPVEWLLREFDVDARWCLVHATHVDPAELKAAAASGAVAGLCPTTEADLGDGLFHAEAWLGAGGRFGIGTDSNLRVTVSEELRWLEFQARLSGLRRIVLADRGRSCGRSLYERAAQGGAQALGQPAGRIEPGLRADLVELDANHPLLQARSGDAILDTWIFAGGGDMVRSVWVAGVRLVDQGRHRRRGALEGPFRKALEQLS